MELVAVNEDDTLSVSGDIDATALTYLGMTGQQALARLRERRPGSLFNETFAAHVQALPARQVRVQTL
jgi:hypothetical protein